MVAKENENYSKVVYPEIHGVANPLRAVCVKPPSCHPPSVIGINSLFLSPELDQ